MNALAKVKSPFVTIFRERCGEKHSIQVVYRQNLLQEYHNLIQKEYTQKESFRIALMTFSRCLSVRLVQILKTSRALRWFLSRHRSQVRST